MQYRLFFFHGIVTEMAFEEFDPIAHLTVFSNLI